MMQDDPLADLTGGSGPSIYTIAPGRPFLTDLARLLLNRFAGDPISLADLMIFLPTRRAARALSEAFLGAAGALPAATLLPRIYTLGDLDEDDLMIRTNADNGIGARATDLQPPVSSLERLLVLARFIHQKDQWSTDGHSASWVTALNAADELAALLDSFYTEQVPFERLADLVPEQYARHWQVSLDFMEIITQQWPAYLKAQGKLDPADYRRQLIDALTASWDISTGGAPPLQPVLIAGSTGSMPAVARLMQLVAGLAHGAVVLPGLDTGLDEVAWQEIEDPHPQAGLKYLLADYFEDLHHSAIPEWPMTEIMPRKCNRQEFLSLALRPAKATDDWHRLLAEATGLEQATEDLSLVEAADEALEAQVIAVAMREALDTEGKTATLVTPDRVLARRVSTRLARWNIKLDDSGGVPFANTLRGNFLRLVAAWLVDISNPVRLLTLLKHPLCHVGMEGRNFTSVVHVLDLALRGLRPGQGFDGLRARLQNGGDWDALTRGEESLDVGGRQKQTTAEIQWSQLRSLIDRLEEIATPFLNSGPEMADYLKCHLQAAEHLCSTAGADERSRLWAYEDGEAGATLMAQVYEQAGLLPACNMETYPDIFMSLIAGAPVRLRGDAHPRLMILGPLEARLQQADLMILGGLNEGSWPDESKADSFLSRAMRKELGLPSWERRVGLAAHDFAQNASASEVLLTRAKRKGRSPARPSRWIVRLKNVLTGAKLLDRIDKTVIYENWVAAMDAPKAVHHISPPAPCPPLEARPRKLAVTYIEKLLRDPYSIFASRILRLRKLDCLALDPGYAVRGRFYHSIFAQFALDYPDRVPDDPLSVLHGYAEQLFERTRLDDAVKAFWQVRMEESFGWFVVFHKAAVEQGEAAIVEGKGGWSFALPNGAFRLEARADRIDLQNSQAFIFDYKTGRIPSEKQGRMFSPQLQLTALIAEQGGFETLGKTRTAGFAYLKVLNRKDVGAIHGKDDLWLEEDAARVSMDEAAQAVFDHLSHYDDPSTPYLSQPRAFYRNDFGNYDDLARRGEWIIDGDDE